MCKDEPNLNIKINEILINSNISTNLIEIYQKNNRKVDYLIDKKYILKISKQALDEKNKLYRVKDLLYVPKIHSLGTFNISGEDYHYLIEDFIKGNDLFSALPSLNEEDSIKIGKEIAQFLTNLHSIKDSYYDIGHYIPTIPRYKQSWMEGHLEYLKLLKNGLSKMSFSLSNEELITSAFDYIYSNINALEYQRGPRLLHNDLHPKNIIINNGKLSGIIDWECSQYGEVDFELAHLFHWCIYPLEPNKSFELLLKTVYENLMIILNIPNMNKRLTIYQLEHELNQLIWSRKQEEERIERIKGWLSGQIDNLIEKW